MSYIETLLSSYEISGSVVCMGLDPRLDSLPSGGGVKERIISFFTPLFETMREKNILPGAFKANIGFYTCLDKPRKGEFAGSLALSRLLDLLSELFPGIPVILDYKRGDISRSSANYALEGFSCWGADAVTVSPFMGTDSVLPFLKEAHNGNNGVYILNRTSNPGAGDFQSLRVEGGMFLFEEVAGKILNWSRDYPGTGAVIGATSLNELATLLDFYMSNPAPLLIPGVGSQGGSMEKSAGLIKRCGYPPHLVRINSSSGLTAPWGDGEPPENWLAMCTGALSALNAAARGAGLK